MLEEFQNKVITIYKLGRNELEAFKSERYFTSSTQAKRSTHFLDHKVYEFKIQLLSSGEVTTFVLYNAHPQGKEVEDCVKRAITVAAGKDYHQVSLELNRYKKVTGAKTYNQPKNCNAYVENVLGGKRETYPAKKGFRRMDGHSFCETHPTGHYILQMAGHWTACVDGKIYDTWDCRDKCVYSSWQL